MSNEIKSEELRRGYRQDDNFLGPINSIEQLLIVASVERKRQIEQLKNKRENQ